MNRFLYDEVLNWMPREARVLDLGTGDGSFIERLARDKAAHVEGVERDAEQVSRCIERHLIVHQGDLLDGLDQYSKASFDFVLLLGTLQELLDPQTAVKEAFRVGRQVIISYSNFAHWRSRLQLLLTGRAPVTRALPSAWYRTSNTHFFSMLDFSSFCREMEMQEVQSACFSPSGLVQFWPNLRAEYAVSLLEAQPEGLLSQYREASAH